MICAISGGEEIELAHPFLQSHQFGNLAHPAVKVAPQRGDDPHFPLVVGQRRKCVEKPDPLLGVDLAAEEFFELIDDQREAGIGLFCRFGPQLFVAGRL